MNTTPAPDLADLRAQRAHQLNTYLERGGKAYRANTLFFTRAWSGAR